MKICYDDSACELDTKCENCKDYQSLIGNTISDLTNLPIFDWKDIHGKILKMHVYEDINGICVGGIDEKTKIFYLLFQKVI